MADKLRLLLIVWSGSLFSCAGLLAQPPQPGNYSPAQYEVAEEWDRQAPMRDGVELQVAIFRPRAEGKFPAILLQTPYGKDGPSARARQFAQRGYVVVNVDSRGRFESGGQWDPFSPLHKTDGYDLVEWVARQPWCSGRVGTYGLSYMGWTQWWTATQTPPSLKALCPRSLRPINSTTAPIRTASWFALWWIGPA